MRRPQTSTGSACTASGQTKIKAKLYAVYTASKITTKEAKWEQRLANNDIPTWNPKEKLPAGSDLDWGTWKTLNRLRCQMGRCKNNLLKWGYGGRGNM
ncbi:hypothetical protein JTB14_020068 [Gonioctena quinquepunctata]|nr:hypothetical protein JTB14_020068 [Gonioctena quinquepunctata]